MRVLVLLLALLVVPPVAAAQAPVFAPLWSAAVPVEPSPHAPVLGEDVVLVTSNDGSVQGFALRGGEQLWRVQTPAQRLSPPMVHTSLFLVGGDDSRVSIRFLQSGEEMFNFTLGAPILQNMSQNRDYWLVTDESGKVSAFEKGLGRILWQKEVGKGAHSLQLRERTFVIATDQDVILYELERRDQQERRTLPGILCIVESADEVYALRPQGVHRLRETDYVDSWVMGVPAVDCGMLDGDLLYVPTANGTVAALERRTPQVRWETPVLGPAPRILLLPDGWLLATTNGTGGERAAVHLIDATSGKVAATHPLEGASASAPMRSRWSMGDGRIEDFVVVRTDAGLHALALTLPTRSAAPTPTPSGATTATPPASPPEARDSPVPAIAFVAVGAVLAAAWMRRR